MSYKYKHNKFILRCNYHFRLQITRSHLFHEKLVILGTWNHWIYPTTNWCTCPPSSRWACASSPCITTRSNASLATFSATCGRGWTPSSCPTTGCVTTALMPCPSWACPRPCLNYCWTTTCCIPSPKASCS